MQGYYPPAIEQVSVESIEQEKVREARLQRERIYAQTDRQLESVLLIGKELHAIKKDYDNISLPQEWKEAVYGFESYKAYLASPREEQNGLDVPYSSANTYSKLYRVFVLGLGYTIKELVSLELHYSKLNMIAPYVTEENKEELLRLCRLYSKNTLDIELEDYKKTEEAEKEEEGAEPEEETETVLAKVKRLKSSNAKSILEILALNLEESRKQFKPVTAEGLLRLIENAIKLS